MDRQHRLLRALGFNERTIFAGEATAVGCCHHRNQDVSQSYLRVEDPRGDIRFMQFEGKCSAQLLLFKLISKRLKKEPPETSRCRLLPSHIFQRLSGLFTVAAVSQADLPHDVGSMEFPAHRYPSQSVVSSF